MCMKPINFNSENARKNFWVFHSREVYSLQSNVVKENFCQTLKKLNIFARMFHSSRSRLLTVQRYIIKNFSHPVEKKPLLIHTAIRGKCNEIRTTEIQ